MQDDQTLPNVNWIGSGFNVFGTLSSLTEQIVDPGPCDQETRVGDRTYCMPAHCRLISDSRYEAEFTTAESFSEFQEKITASVDISGKYQLFSGEVSTRFDVSTERSGKYYYATAHQFAGLYAVDFKLRPKYEEMAAPARNLPHVYDSRTREQFDSFFRRFGVFYVKKIFCGGSIDVTTTTESYKSYTEMNLEAQVKAQYNGLTSSAQVSAEAAWKTVEKSWFDKSRSTVVARGGDPTRLIQGAVTYQEWLNGGNSIQQWRDTISAQPAVISFQLAPVWELFDDGEHREQYLAVEAAAHDFLGSVLTVTAPLAGRMALYIGPKKETVYFDNRNGVVLLDRRDLSVYKNWSLNARDLETIKREIQSDEYFTVIASGIGSQGSLMTEIVKAAEGGKSFGAFSEWEQWSKHGASTSPWYYSSYTMISWKDENTGKREGLDQWQPDKPLTFVLPIRKHGDRIWSGPESRVGFEVPAVGAER
jgi:hypothetical protein